MNVPARLALLLALPLLLLHGCAFRRIVRFKNITYQSADAARPLPAQELNVFSPRRHRKTAKRDVLIYIYGGNWNSGRKELYNWFGSRLARKGIVAVVVDYPKSPAADFRVMAADVAQAVSWVQAHIAEYGGNPARVFISGHSAGGHLAALVTANDHLAQAAGIAGPLKGVILIDAAGLDMYGYLKDDSGLFKEPSYAKTFSTDPKTWKEATPLYHLHAGMPPMLIYQGGRTYPSIARGYQKFVAGLKELGMSPSFHVLPGKKHIPMITQFFNTGNPRYREILQFMGQQQ